MLPVAGCLYERFEDSTPAQVDHGSFQHGLHAALARRNPTLAVFDPAVAERLRLPDYPASESLVVLNLHVIAFLQ